jgi:nicotinate-nucleotide pyrophosphorylase (carboxylating)
MILIKDNHLVLAGSVTEAVRRARAGRWRRLPVEVEVKTMDELREALAAGVDRVMLDNMTPAQVRRASALAAGLVPLEVSGGITPAKVSALRGAGVDFLSSGALTHSVRALDFSLEVTAAP